MSKLQTALSYARAGFAVFPIQAGQKFPPLLDNWPANADRDQALIEQWWDVWPEANIGVHCENHIVIDVDVAKGGDDSLAILDAIYELPETLTVRTPTGGRHLYFRGPNVGNSVEKLGKGLDIRSARGYVVGAGSTVAAGEYKVELAVAPAEAPDWLIETLGKAAERDAGPREAVPAAADYIVEQARAWLLTQAGAVQGQGGDHHTFQVAVGLRDRGVSAQQALDLLVSDWNDECAPPWSLDDLQVKVDNAYRYAQNAQAGSMAILEDRDLPAPVHTPSAFTAPQTAHVNKLQRLSEFAESDADKAGYLIKGILRKHTYAAMAGQPGQGKTFVALDMAYHVAAGLPWMGHKTKQGPVLYLPFEDAGGVRTRARALRQHYGTADVPLYFDDSNYNLRTTEGRQALGKTLAELPSPPSLIIIDTFAYALCGGDENSAQDVGAFNEAISQLIKHTGACVMVIHHPPKNGEGLRGSGALFGAVRTTLQVADREVRATKQSNDPLGDPIGFNLAEISIGFDEDGDPITSCVVTPHAVQKGERKKLKTGSREAMAFDVLCKLRPTNDPITDGEWVEACSEFLPTGKESRRTNWYRVKSQLMKYGLITEDEHMYQRKME